MSRPEAARARPDRTAEGKPLSTESIATQTLSPAAPVAHCASCNSPLDFDQRYCLECGERCSPHDGVPSVVPHGSESQQSPHASGAHAPHASGPPIHATHGSIPPQPSSTPQRPPHSPPAEHSNEHSSATALLAGVGVLLLAMGVGVLIGRSSGSPTGAAQPAPQVITVTAPASSERSPERSTTAPSGRQTPKAAKHHGGSRVGSSVSKPAPSSVLEGLSHAKGKSYVEKSKNLPDVVSTG